MSTHTKIWLGPPNWYALTVRTNEKLHHCESLYPVSPVSPTSLEICVVYEVYEVYEILRWGKKCPLEFALQKEKSFRFQEGQDPRPRTLPWTPLGVRPRHPSVPSAPKLPLYHWPAFVSDPHHMPRSS